MLMASPWAPSAALTPDAGDVHGRWPVAVSKETTYLVEPLGRGGTPDYVAALNRQGALGTSSQDNAVVAMAGVLGPEMVAAPDREQFYRLLGVGPPAPEGQYFIPYEAYVKRRAPAALRWRQEGDSIRSPTADLQEDRSLHCGWSKEECPLVAGWLAENEKPLARVVAAARQARFYLPLVVGTHGSDLGIGGPVGDVVPPVAINAPARALRARAMLHVREGDLRRARDDLQACHRLARLMGQSATMTVALEASAIDMLTTDGDLRLAHYATLSKQQARSISAEIRALPPLPSLLEKFGIWDRFLYLDTVCRVARGVKVDSEIATAERRRLLTACADKGLLDWNAILHLGNRRFDAVVAAGRIAEPAARWRALSAACDEAAKWRSEAKSILAMPPEEAAASLSPAAVTEGLCSVYMLPASNYLGALIRLERVRAIFSDLTEISLVLGAYRTEHGRYPQELRELQPRFLPALPKDPYGGEDFRYRAEDHTPEGDGYVLYSVGPDGKDNGGPKFPNWGFGDDEALRTSDDIGVRMPGGKSQREGWPAD
jgi:hypothetical protein